jgi:hypothetical protein
MKQAEYWPIVARCTSCCHTLYGVPLTPAIEILEKANRENVERNRRAAWWAS